MSVETSAVQISVNVTDNTSAQVLSGVEQNLNKLGGAGMRSGAQVEAGMQQAGRGMLSATEKTRLAAEEMGVRLPRAMITLIGQSKAAQAVLSGLSTAMIGFATIQIGAMVGEAIYAGVKKIYEKWLDVDGAIRRYNDEAGKAASKKFYEDAGLDQLNADLLKANAQLDQLNQKRINSVTWGPAATQFSEPGVYKIARLFGANIPTNNAAFKTSDANAQNIAQGDKDAAHLKLIDDTHKRNLQQIGDQKLIAEARVIGITKARVAQNAENKKADEDRDYTRKRAQAQAEIANRGIDNKRWNGNLKPGDTGYREAVVVSPDAGNAENTEAKAHAGAEFQAQQFEIGREHAHELVRLREQALEAGLRGIALYKAQEAAAIEELKFKDMDSVAARNAVHDKFHAEEMKRLQEQEHAIAKMREQTQLAGLTGIPRLQQEEKNRIKEVYDPNNGLNPGQRLAEVNEIHKQTVQEIGALNKSFSERVDEIVGTSASRELQGFARISADAQNEIRKLREEARKNGGKPEDLARGEAGINAGAAGQAGVLTRKNSQETEQLESRARVKFLSAEKQKTAAIAAELVERKQKYHEELVAQEISQDDYNRRVAAAEMEANGERIQAATEARKKMAGEFTSMFEEMNHPLKMLEKLGNKAAGEAAASMVQRAQQHFQGGKGGAGADATGGAGGIFGDVLGGFGFSGFGKKGKTPGAGAHVGAAIPGVHTAAEQSFSIASATIHVGSATITGSGAGAGYGPGSSTATGKSIGPGGSTAAGNAGISVPGSTALMSPGSVGGASTSAGAAASGITGMTNMGGSVASATGTHELGHALGDVNQGVGLTKQLIKNFKGSDSGNAGTADSAKDDSSSSGGPSGMTRATGIVQGGVGLWAAHEGGGGVGGGLKGAASGAEMGLMIGGPIGAVVGAAAGAIIGGIGSGKNAREYDLKTVRPRIANDLEAYHSGGMNYLAAYSDAQSLQMEADQTTKKMGPADSRYFGSTIIPEIKQLMGKLDSEQRAGRSMYSASTASYATGTNYVPETGYGFIHKGEGVFDSSRNERLTQAAESMSRMPVQSPSMGDVHLHVHAIDAHGVAGFLDKYKHNIRSAVNDSYAENSGGGLN
jgi:hypothetical protein